MATIKGYTTLEQSRKLAEILPLESADMYYSYDHDFGEHESIPTITEEDDHFVLFPDDIPCWSLVALLNVFPEYTLQRTDWGSKIEHKIVVDVNDDSYASKNYEHLVDACVATIEQLHELKLM